MGQQNSTSARKRNGLLPDYRDSTDRLPSQGYHQALYHPPRSYPPLKYLREKYWSQKEKQVNTAKYDNKSDKATPLPLCRSLTPPPSYSVVDHSPDLLPSYSSLRPLPRPEPSPCIPNPPCHVCPSQAVRPSKPHEVLHRYMIEIVAHIFCTDFDKLNSAMLDLTVTDGTTSILTQRESDDLLRYSRLMNQAENWREPRLTYAEGQELQVNVTEPGAHEEFPLWMEDMGELMTMYEYLGTGVSRSRHIEISTRVAEVGLEEYKGEQWRNLYEQRLKVLTRSVASYHTILTKLKLNARAESVILQGMSDFQESMKRASLDPEQYYFLSRFSSIMAIGYAAGFIYYGPGRVLGPDGRYTYPYYRTSQNTHT
ncbi:hypothetical protein DM02DRAFT_658102 [Periconia macrospinosa]|uniref:Uncharacterized protein n=1 Tax=Periconia macrospinosa TaxID=97972 RepID=A0A2V1DHR4_9PLEO|nr:hypothetical protein DM02DRAFT_658102 [Periconia macrospinosa]